MKKKIVYSILILMTSICMFEPKCDSNIILEQASVSQGINRNLFGHNMIKLTTYSKLLIKANNDTKTNYYCLTNNQESKETIYDFFTDEEVFLIQRVIETETYQADFNSKCNVASVVLNRLYHSEFPNNIKKVIKTPNQFDYKRTKISDDTIEVLEYVWEHGDTTNGAIAFHSNKKTSTFFGYKYLYTDQAGHHFYDGEEKIIWEK